MDAEVPCMFLQEGETQSNVCIQTHEHSSFTSHSLFSVRCDCLKFLLFMLGFYVIAFSPQASNNYSISFILK